MKKVKVEITGISPLLMNNPISMLNEANGLSSKTTKRDIKKDAEILAYKTDKGELYIPSEAIKGCLVNAGAYKKFGKFAAKPFIAGGVVISPSKIGLGTKEYTLDVRTVVIQRARVPKARPMVEHWKATFELSYDETLIADDTLLRPILEEGGKRIGILDFRPQKLGNFGMFEVTKWQKQ